MAVTMRVEGLERVRRNLRRSLRAVAGPVATAVLTEMARSAATTIRRGSKRKKPRFAAVKTGRSGSVELLTGWHEGDDSALKEYLEPGLTEATGRGFRRAVKRGQREFSRARFR